MFKGAPHNEIFESSTYGARHLPDCTHFWNGDQFISMTLGNKNYLVKSYEKFLENTYKFL